MPPSSNDSSSIDSRTGFCSKSKIYHSLRPSISLPPQNLPLSITSYLFSLLNSHPPPPNAALLIDALSPHRIPYSHLLPLVKTLAFTLKTNFNLSKYDTAFVLSHNSVHVPLLYLSLFSLGVVVSPSNPANTKQEILRQIHLSKPVIAFATSDAAHKLPSLKYGTVLLDAPQFDSLMTTSEVGDIMCSDFQLEEVSVLQSDPAAILYSSGTTGAFKGVVLTHRNWIASLASAYAVRAVRERETTTSTPPPPAVAFCTVPYFHVYGFRYCITALAMGQSLVCMGRFDFGVMLRAIEELKVRNLALAPPVAVKMAQDGVVDGYDLSSLEVLACGGAPLKLSVIEKFKQTLPRVPLAQGYGLTEATGRVFGTVGPKECQVVGATGKLVSNCLAKIVDPNTGIAQPPCSPGELWLKGAFNMKGYVNDEEATAAILDSEGWLKTGDLCYIDSDGFLFVVDRLKEVIKYNGYQVAPSELEHLLHSNPDIVDTAVIPYPDEQAGQVPLAFVVRKFGSTIDESQIKYFIAKQVAPYKRIRKVSFVNSIPRNASGKVLRKDLIKLAQLKAISKL